MFSMLVFALIFKDFNEDLIISYCVCGKNCVHDVSPLGNQSPCSLHVCSVVLSVLSISFA